MIHKEGSPSKRVFPLGLGTAPLPKPSPGLEFATGVPQLIPIRPAANTHSSGPFVGHLLVAATTPLQKVDNFFGGLVENTLISTKKLKSKDPTQ